MDLRLLKKEAAQFGLYRLAKETGLARSFLYRIMNGLSIPTLSSFEKIAHVLGFEVTLRRTRSDSVYEVSKQVAHDHNWKIHYFNFVDSFRRTGDAALVRHPPVKTLSKREMALLASITLQLCDKLRTVPPDWAQKKHLLKNPWFVSGSENLKAMAIVESPPFFKRNNIFVLENFLARA